MYSTESHWKYVCSLQFTEHVPFYGYETIYNIFMIYMYIDKQLVNFSDIFRLFLATSMDADIVWFYGTILCEVNITNTLHVHVHNKLQIDWHNF